jgi:nucleoside-diphosphate-sugar epimerase
MATIAVTGVGGLIGRALVASLCEAPGEVTRVIGFDVRVPEDLAGSGGPADRDRPDSCPPALDLHVMDVRDPALEGLLEGVDVLVHLAFQFDPIRDLDEMRSINVDGTRAVLEAARASSVPRVIYLSSVLAYDPSAPSAGDPSVPSGGDPSVPSGGDPSALTESSPLCPSGGFAYASHKREVETWLWPWHAAGDGPALTVLRSAAVLGPGVQNFVTRAFEQAVIPELPDPPPLQFVHVDDVVGAIVHALRTPIDGAFNVAPDGGIDFDRTVTLIGRPTVPMDVATLERLAVRGHRLGLLEVDAGIVDLFRHRWVMSNERLRATGWTPTRSNEEALLETMLEHEGYLALGRVRLPRRALRAAGLAAAAGLLAAGAAALRRR